MKKIVDILKDTFEKTKSVFLKAKEKLGIKKLIAIGVVIIFIIVLLFSCGGEDEAQATYVRAEASYGNIVETIEQSGTVEPYERREITALVRGEVIASPFNEGDMVEEGDTLYQIDDEDAQLNYEKSQISYNEVVKDIANLNIYAPASGTLTNFKLSVGDSVNGGEIGRIINDDELIVKIPFTAADFDKISIGDSATVTSASYMMMLKGTVTYKYDSNAGTEADGSYLKNVEISISNPGSLVTGVTVAGNVNTSRGIVYSAKSGSVESGGNTSLRAEVSGTVEKLGAKNGDKVKKGQLIAVLSNDSLNNNRITSQLSLRSTQKSLEDYNITAPISGTIITKNVEAGDKIDNSNASTILMVVADMSKMKFTISVDELDLGDISIGQSVNVTADAIPNERFEGYVSKIAAEGTVSGQGVTTYDVEIIIDEPGELRSGMSVNASIIVAEARDVLSIPESALNGAKDGKATVYISNGKESENAVFPDDFEAREVEYGMSNGTLAEIKSGLSEGEIVVYIDYTGGDNDFMRMMMGMHGNMQGGNQGSPKSNMQGGRTQGSRPGGM
ncbi:MAG: efflux RND transporter periplasmic adaptor subunit [Clostridia bacterium]|nr:efflux RND transporter periplasmic adaptor subunit [Clostridia bacterium]